MKRLIVCCDGTWQKLASPYPTNVVKLAQAIKSYGDDQIPQIVFYNEGLGTGNFFDRIFGGAFGEGISHVIQNAYRFLCLNYDPKDEIYLFGFSRGAYTVRSLAGLIYNCGLLNRSHIRKTPQAYELYRDRTKETNYNSERAKNFRNQYSQEVDITFLGCWDTVGSLGIPNQSSLLPLDTIVNRQYQFHDTRINRRIKCARHAVAIDEMRKVFYVTPMHKTKGADTDIKQVWFPGTHGCVGGGLSENRHLSDAALEWMITEVTPQGLGIDLTKIEDGIKIDPTATFTQPKGIYTDLGLRIRYLSDDPNLDANTIDDLGDFEQQKYIYAHFDDLHESVKKRWSSDPTYRPSGLGVFNQRLDKSCSSS